MTIACTINPYVIARLAASFMLRSSSIQSRHRCRTIGRGRIAGIRSGRVDLPPKRRGPSVRVTPPDKDDNTVDFLYSFASTASGPAQKTYRA